MHDLYSPEIVHKRAFYMGTCVEGGDSAHPLRRGGSADRAGAARRARATARRRTARSRLRGPNVGDGATGSTTARGPDRGTRRQGPGDDPKPSGGNGRRDRLRPGAGRGGRETARGSRVDKTHGASVVGTGPQRKALLCMLVRIG